VSFLTGLGRWRSWECRQVCWAPIVHINHNPIANVPAGIHSAGAAEKAAAAQRATETRRKLMKSAGQTEVDAEEPFDAGGFLIVGKWSEQAAQQRERPATSHKQDAQMVEDDLPATPISVWA